MFLNIDYCIIVVCFMFLCFFVTGHYGTRGSEKEIHTTQNRGKHYRLPFVSIEFASYLLWLVSRSVGCSLGGSVAQSLGRSVGRWIGGLEIGWLLC